MLKIKLYRNEPVDSALKRLRRKVQKEGVLKDLFERRAFKSPSEKRREVRRKAEYLNSFRNA